jgi:hypothetical protein
MLVDIARPDKLSRMFYSNFETHITDKFGIVVVNWPLPQFASPCALGSCLELQTLRNAWQSGSTYFRRLSREELVQWQKQRLNAPTANQSQIGTPETTAGLSQVGSNPLSPQAHAHEHDASQVNAIESPPSINVSSISGAAPALPTPEPGLVPSAGAPPGPSTSVFAISTAGVVTKKPRKQRSDKGKKRGTRNKPAGGDY